MQTIIALFDSPKRQQEAAIGDLELAGFTRSGYQRGGRGSVPHGTENGGNSTGIGDRSVGGRWLARGTGNHRGLPGVGLVLAAGPAACGRRVVESAVSRRIGWNIGGHGMCRLAGGALTTIRKPFVRALTLHQLRR